MEYLQSHFGGDDFMTYLHNADPNGFEGLQAALDEFGYEVEAQQVVHDFLASMAVDEATSPRPWQRRPGRAEHRVDVRADQLGHRRGVRRRRRSDQRR